MRGLFTNQTFILQPGQAVSGIAKQPQTLRILRGHVWITVEGINQDYWLTAGDTFTAMPGKMVVVEADTTRGDMEAAIAHKQSAPAKFVGQLRTLLQRMAWTGNTRAGLIENGFGPCKQRSQCCA